MERKVVCCIYNGDDPVTQENDDEEIINEGLEKVSNQVVEHTTTEVHTTTEDHTEEPKTKRPRISVLQEKSMSFRMGQNWRKL